MRTNPSPPPKSPINLPHRLLRAKNNSPLPQPEKSTTHRLVGESSFLNNTPLTSRFAITQKSNDPFLRITNIHWLHQDTRHHSNIKRRGLKHKRETAKQRRIRAQLIANICQKRAQKTLKQRILDGAGGGIRTRDFWAYCSGPFLLSRL